MQAPERRKNHICQQRISISVSLLFLVVLASALWFVPEFFDTHRENPHHEPLAKTRNGTFAGTHNFRFDQDIFLGMPYAQAPIGDLRFHYPRSINVSWNHIQPALEYGPHCIGYGVSHIRHAFFISDIIHNVGPPRTIQEIGRLSHIERCPPFEL